MSELAFQDQYPDSVAHCYGCGRLNPAGLHLKTRWDGDDTVTRFTPRPEHVAIPGFVYGGLVASLIDCHGTGTAAATAARTAGQPLDSSLAFRFVTASVHVDFLRPTPMGVELELRGRVVRVDGKRVVVAITVQAGDAVTARGEVVAVPMPRSFEASAR
jgi:acyl-coenzyme A thioesterase PaaI-like protein